jgi:hypothetical protein
MSIENVGEGRTDMPEGARKLAESAGAAASRIRGEGGKIASEAGEGIGRMVESVRARFEGRSYEDVRDEVRTYIRRNPGRTLLYALGAGFVIGLIVRR